MSTNQNLIKGKLYTFLTEDDARFTFIFSGMEEHIVHSGSYMIIGGSSGNKFVNQSMDLRYDKKNYTGMTGRPLGDGPYDIRECTEEENTHFNACLLLGKYIKLEENGND